MLQKVNTKTRKIKAYKGIIEDSLYQEVNFFAKKLKGVKVLHINATSFGGGVAEILHSLIPLMQNLGLKAEWQTIVADDRLFEITKIFHNAFQGEECCIDKKIERTYKRFNAYNAHLIEGEWDIIVIHDPQPAAIPYYLAKDDVKRIWRCHIDTSSPNKKMWEFFKPFLCEYDAAIFTLKEFFPKDLPVKKRFFVSPAIDPLSSKNKMLSENTVKRILKSYNINPDRPIITQVSRFDLWKDPLGVVKAYKIAKRRVPNLQLVLVGSMADDDPEGWKIYKSVEECTRKDRDIYLFTNLGNIEVSAFQIASNIVLQKSIKEGFGLTVTEAMWKGTPVIGGRAGGITLQIEDNKTGCLVNSAEECAGKILFLLKNPEFGQKIAERAKEHVRKKFLLPRLLRDHFRIYLNLVEAKKLKERISLKNTF